MRMYLMYDDKLILKGDEEDDDEWALNGLLTASKLVRQKFNKG
jgi:hypothetical protein